MAPLPMDGVQMGLPSPPDEAHRPGCVRHHLMQSIRIAHRPWARARLTWERALALLMGSAEAHQTLINAHEEFSHDPI